jgi:hypothetical protein
MTATADFFEPTLNVCIHGVGTGAKGANIFERWRVAQTLGVPPELVKGFYYEDILDGAQVNMFYKAGAKLFARYFAPKISAALVEAPVDILEDIFLFFFSAQVRDQIEARLKNLLGDQRRVRLLAHSLGSLIAYWFCVKNAAWADRIELVTLGSQLGSPFLESIVKYWMARLFPGRVARLYRPRVISWHNIASNCDPLSGQISPDLCLPTCQYTIPISATVMHSDIAMQIDYYIKLFYKPPSPAPLAA